MAQRHVNYWDYIKVEEMLALQGGIEASDETLENDEVRFIVIHQIDELWFKLGIRELVSDPERLNALLVGQQSHCPGPVGAPHASVEAERIEYLAQRLPDVRVREWLMGQGTGSGNLDSHVVAFRKRNHVGQIGERLCRGWWLIGLDQSDMIYHHLGVWMPTGKFAKEGQLARTHNIHRNASLSTCREYSIKTWIVRF